MRLSDLDFQYPERLVSTEPSRPFRGMLVSSCEEDPREISKDELLDFFSPGDLLLINNTRVQKRRVFTPSGLEVLFLKEESENEWSVLFPASRLKEKTFELSQQVSAELLQKGLPQKIRVSKKLDNDFFAREGHFALPPYIQKARGERLSREEDDFWYQTEWALKEGSTAAPTASLHFEKNDLDKLRSRGVHVEELTLHVGLGTFLPVKTDNLAEHVMHKEYAEVSARTIEIVHETKRNNHRVWCLGTTATRAIESAFLGLLEKNKTTYFGETDLFIRPGFEFLATDALITNFHQPKSTLLALVAAFAGLEKVKKSYQWAIQNEFKLFSYGNSSIWLREK